MSVFARKSIHEAVINHTNTRAITCKELQEILTNDVCSENQEGISLV